MTPLRWGLVASVVLTISVQSAAEAITPNQFRPAGQTRPSAKPATTHMTAPSSAAQNAPNTGTTNARSTPAARPATVRSQGTSTSTVIVPAPRGEAEAYAAKVGSILALSHTKATAGGSGESSTANPLELLGVAALGGTQNGSGSNSGSLLDTGTTPLGRLALAPWSVHNGSSPSGNTAAGLADIVLLDLGDPTTPASVTLRVLHSSSSAQWTPAASSASGSTDGAILDVGGPSGLVVDVLHSQTNSSGVGSSYLLSINGNEIGTSGQTNGACALTIPAILSLDCLTATGGTGILGLGGTTGQTSGAGVLSTTLGGTTTGLTAALLQSNSSSGRAPSGTGTGTGTGTGRQTGGNGTGTTVGSSTGKTPAAAAAKPIASGHLAFTGAEIADALAVGGSAVAFGLVLVGTSKRRRRLA